MTSRNASAFLTALLGVLIGLTALGMDLFLPSVPSIAHAFGEEAPAGQLAVTTYLLGLACGQLAWGPLADRFGRKPVLLAALALFFVSSVGCALAGSLEAVVLLRFAHTVMIGQMVGGFAGSRLVGRLGIERMIRFGAALALASGFALALLAYAQVSHWSAIVLPMLGYILGCAFLVPNATAAAMTPFPRMAGSASSLLGALPFAFGALISAGLGSAFDGTERPFALAVALAGAGAFAAERLLLRPVARAARASLHG